MKPLSICISEAARTLNTCGAVVSTESWQGMKSPPPMIEVLWHSFTGIIPQHIGSLVGEVDPDLPWADVHFDERVSGKPYNPPPSHTIWPYARADNEGFMDGKIFSHTYPERFWPKRVTARGGMKPKATVNQGVRYPYGDLNDVVNLLIKEPQTRQAFLPVWFPEDTGVNHGGRVPCTIGYHFVLRNDWLHCSYYIRSCDFIRHFRNDIYFACRLVMWVIDRCAEDDDTGIRWSKVKPGSLRMNIDCLHCFENDRYGLRKWM